MQDELVLKAQEDAGGSGFLDFTEITRGKGKVDTEIRILMPQASHLVQWIRLAECNITPRRRGIWEVAAYLLNATDGEHDSAYALRFEIVGGVFLRSRYGQTLVEGWIRGDSAEYFRVPPPDYNPLTRGAVKCKHCRKKADKHLIVPEGCFVPKSNTALFEQVRGCYIEITTGVVS